MAKICKHQKQNQIEHKCSDYYDRHYSKVITTIVKIPRKRRIECMKTGTTRYCRLTEWKRKHGTCPYDSSIQAQSKPKQGQSILPEQKTI